MKYFKKIAGERLFLALVCPDDAEQYCVWMNDPQVSVGLGQYAFMTGILNEKKWCEDASAARDRYDFAIVKNDETLLGNCGFFNISPHNRSAKLGIFIGDEQNRSCGYGAEALRLLVNYGFNTLNLHSISLTVYAFNERGIHCYKNVGFSEVGRLREAIYSDGKYYDEIHMDILRGEVK